VIANNAEEKRANFSKILDGKPLFSAVYGMYRVTLNELKAVLKMSAQAGRSGVVNETSVESTDQDARDISLIIPRRQNNQSQHPQLSSCLRNQC
jgi:hypothetical protein